jgi:hypothetical protein
MIDKVNGNLYYFGAAQPHILTLSPRCSTMPSLISLGSRTWLLTSIEVSNTRQIRIEYFVFSLMFKV